MDFTPQQKYSLLSKMGYTGSMQGDEMDKFLQSNPGAAAKMGKFNRALTRGFQTGGLVAPGQTALLGNRDFVGDPSNRPYSVPYVPPAPTPVAPTTTTAPTTEEPTPDVFKDQYTAYRPTSRSPEEAKKLYKNRSENLINKERKLKSVTPKITTREDGKIKVQGVQTVFDSQEAAEQYLRKNNPTYRQAVFDLNNAQRTFSEAQQDLEFAQTQAQALMPSAAEVSSQALADPSSLVTQAEPERIPTKPGQFVRGDTGVVKGRRPEAQVTTTGPAAEAQAPDVTPAATMEATTVTPRVRGAVKDLEAAQGEVSQTITAAQGELSPGAIADGATFSKEFVQTIQASDLPVTPEQLVVAQGQDAIAPAAKIAQSSGIDPAVAAQATVSVNELPEAAQIKESEMAQAEAVVSSGQLSEDAVAVAAKLDSFTVDNGTLAEAVQGNVNAQDTIQGQLANLMRQFDDGTPAWAAGAMRAANSVMAARGLGGSSMAGAAILQAAMESALPIAAQDAQTFAQMNLSNLDRRQQVALTNAAAQQGLSLQNLNNEQQAALQNSANAFQLQVQDLTNMQQTLIANAQIKASLQGQNLSNRQQANLATAARYAEVSNMNLNNRQQTALQNNANNLQIELSNLSNRQQSYIANAQLEASLQNQIIDNQQQAAIQNAARISEAANIQFSAEQQSKLHNSELMKTIGLAELNSEQAAILQNAAQVASMDMTNLNNRQQAAVQNAQNFLQMDLTNLNNEQQTAIFKSQQRVNALLSDQAAENAAEQFNAASENQTNQFFADLASTTSRFNADQSNAIAQFNAGQENATEQFNASLQEQRAQFNANNRLIVAQANAKWRQDIATLDTAAQNEAIMEAAKTANGLTATAMDEIWQRERDLMNFSFQTAENAQDRYTELLIADKRFETEQILQAQELSAADKAGKGAIFGSIAGELVGGLVDSIF